MVYRAYASVGPTSYVREVVKCVNIHYLEVYRVSLFSLIYFVLKNINRGNVLLYSVKRQF